MKYLLGGYLPDDLFFKLGVTPVTNPRTTDILCPTCKKAKLRFNGRKFTNGSAAAGWTSTLEKKIVYEFVCPECKRIFLHE